MSLREEKIYLAGGDLSNRSKLTASLEELGAQLSYSPASATRLLLVDGADDVTEKAARRHADRAGVPCLPASEFLAGIGAPAASSNATALVATSRARVDRPKKSVLASVPVVNLLLPDRVPCAGVHKVRFGSVRVADRFVRNSLIALACSPH